MNKHKEVQGAERTYHDGRGTDGEENIGGDVHRDVVGDAVDKGALGAHCGEGLSSVLIHFVLSELERRENRGIKRDNPINQRRNLMTS